MRVRWIFAAAAVFIAAFPTSAQAGDSWRVVDTAGVVRVGGPGVMPVALTRDRELPADAWIETASGRAVLVRGEETVLVEPNSRVQLPGDTVNGNTQVLQNLGSAIYTIGKQKKPHFQVDTPYMAAVVKGTAFTVTVGAGNASVAVSEGLVEVSTPGQADVEFVRPGFTALVTHDSGGEISIERTRPSEGPQTPEATPKNDRGNTQAVLIPAAIGNLDVDVKEVSGGLVTSDVVTVATNNVKDVATLVPNAVDAVVQTPTLAPVVGAVAPVVDAVAPVGDTVAPVVDIVAPVVDIVAPVVAPVIDVTQNVGGSVVGDLLDTIRGPGIGLGGLLGHH